MHSVGVSGMLEYSSPITQYGSTVYIGIAMGCPAL